MSQPIDWAKYPDARKEYAGYYAERLMEEGISIRNQDALSRMLMQALGLLVPKMNNTTRGYAMSFARQIVGE